MPLSFQHQGMGWNQYTPSINKHIKKQMQYGNNLNLGIFLIRVVCLKRILQHLKTQHSVNQGWKKQIFCCRKLHSMINILWKSSSHFDFKPLKLHLWHVTTCSMSEEHRSPNRDLVLQIQRIKYFSSHNRVTSRSALRQRSNHT